MSLGMLPAAAACGTVLLLLALAPSASGEDAAGDGLGGSCLDDAVAPESLAGLVVDGVSLPLGIWLYRWGSAELLAHLYALLARDALGYEVAWSGASDTSPPGLFAVAGCDAPLNTTSPQCNGSPAQATHVVLEFWASVAYNMGWMERHYPNSVPEELGSVGYASSEGIYVARAQCDAAAAEGVHLEYYGFYHSEWHDVTKYFDDYRTIPVADLLPCTETELYQSAVMGLVVKWFPDETITVGPSGLQAKCADGFWWQSPGCRRFPARCIPFVTAGEGWYVQMAMQRAIAHSLPLAIATTADMTRYRSIPRQHRVLAYWWEPADHFLDLAPLKLAFPPYNASEWDQGNYRTADPDVRLTKNVYKGLSTVAPRAYKLAEKISIDMSVLNILLQDFSDHGGDARGAACRWLRANVAVWKAWLPRATDCSPGYGLVGPTGAWVDGRGAAVDCLPCGAGNFSQLLLDQEGVTRVCRPCAAGSVQPQRGSDTCSSCEAGYSQNEAGQSLCKRCDKGSFAVAEGSSACAVCPAGKTTDGTGFRTAADCQCAPGTFLAKVAGDCVPCGEGASCPGFGVEPTAIQGYQLGGIEADGLFIFKCFGAPMRCTGGGVGKCANGREGIACALCQPGMTPTNRGTCGLCGHGDSAPFAVVFVAVCLMLVAVYHRAGTDDRAKQSPGALLVVINCGQVVMVLQIIGVFSRLSIAWPEPVQSFLGALRLFTFDIQVLRMDCVGTFTPLARYMSMLSLLPAGLLYLALVHACARVVRRLVRPPDAAPPPGCERGSRASDPLVASTGTLFMMLFIAVVTATLAPLQCQQHPNGVWTMVQYESVVCWRGGEQRTMIAVGMCLMLLPMAFVAAAVCIISAFPKRMEQGDVRFLNTFSFLFSRVKPNTRWFVLGFLIRNLMIALIPAIPQTFVQMLLLQVVFGASLVLLLAYSPWRVPLSNKLDVATHLGLAGFVYLSTFFVPDTDIRTVALISAITIMGGLLILAMTAVASFLPLFIAPKKRFQWFLCHHKAAAGATARLLKMALSDGKVEGEVFIDADNLDDLDQLFGIVAHDVATLVVLCSKDIFRRTWCLGEVATAYVNGVDTLVVRFPDFLPPDAAFVGSIATIVEVNILSEGGLRLSDAQEALEWIRDREHIAAPPLLDRVVVAQLVAGVRAAQRGKGRLLGVGAAAAAPARGPVTELALLAGAAILADTADREAAAAALILQKLMSPLLVGEPAMIPVLYTELPPASDGHHLLGPAATLLVLCTTGCFREPLFLSALLRAQAEGVSATVPIVVREDFRFPTPAFYADLERDVANMALTEQLQEGAGAPLVQYVEVMFKKIALTFNVMASLEALQSQAFAVVRRLLLVRATASNVDVRRPVANTSSPSTSKVGSLSLKVFWSASAEARPAEPSAAAASPEGPRERGGGLDNEDDWSATAFQVEAMEHAVV